MKTGWLRDGENWYYINIYGLFASGWNYVGSDWYYLDPSNGNKMLSNGWYVINGAKYYLNVSGSMAKEWLLLGDEWYYLGADGSMKTGWQLVNGRWYYMYKANDPYGGKEGVMAKNTVIDGYELSDTGAMYNETELAARNVLNSIGWDLRAAFNWSAGLTYYQMTADPSPEANGLQIMDSRIEEETVMLWRPHSVIWRVCLDTRRIRWLAMFRQ